LAAQDLKFHDLLNGVKYAEVFNILSPLASLNRSRLDSGSIDKLALVEVSQNESYYTLMVLHQNQFRH